jgi:predicted dehydrogenase
MATTATAREAGVADQTELRVALIGTGMMGRLHSLAYATLPSFFPDLPPVRRRVVADVSEDVARRGAHQFGYDEWAVGWEDVVSRPDIDIVDIVTPNDSHRPIAELAMRHGKHVLCEKPLAVTAQEARLLAEQSSRSPGVQMVGFNYRRSPAVLEARRLVEEGAIGDALGFRALYLQDWAMPDGTPWSWRFGAKESGSGALGDIGSHALDLALLLVGDIDSVAGATETFVRSRPRSGATGTTAGSKGVSEAQPRSGSDDTAQVDVDDCTIALIRFKNGALGTLEASRFAWGRKNYLTFELSGSKGALAFSWERRNELRYYSASDRGDLQGFRTIICGPAQPSGEVFWPIPGLGTAYYETQVLQTGDFIRAIARGARPETDFAHGCRVQEIMEAILAAAKSSAWVAVSAAARA